MKTPVQMLEDISAEIMENTSLLEFIVRNTSDQGEADNALACLIRSMIKTAEKANEYASYQAMCPPSRSSTDITDDVFYAVITAKKLEELTHNYNEVYFTDKDNDNPSMYMAATIHDYASRVCSELKSIQTKLR